MNLLDPDVGDILDRITILHLKLVRVKERHWEDEITALYTKLQGWTLDIAHLCQIHELAAVNAAIWQAQDEADGSDVNWTRYGMEVHRLNKERCALVQKLNASIGRGAQREKV